MSWTRSGLTCIAGLMLFAAPLWADDDRRPRITVASAVTAEGERVFEDDRLWLRDYTNAMHGIFMTGGISRSSEMGHGNYRPELAGEPMAQRGRRWVRMMQEVDRWFTDEGALAPRLERNGDEDGDGDGWSPAGEPRLADYPDAVYVYHMHHRAGRWREHDLFDALTETSVEFQSDAGRFLLDQRYREGRFYHDADLTRSDRASMAHGLAGIHGHIYAWVRWHKPGAADDMGRVRRERLARFLGYDPDQLVEVAGEIARTLDAAWRQDRDAYDFGDGTTYCLSELGALLRGSKGIYEILYIFGGDEADREQARQVFERTAAMLEALVTSEAVRRDWGVVSQVTFGDDGVEPASDIVDTARQWDLVNHLTGGFTLVREQEGTSRFFERLRPDLLEAVGEFTDHLLTGALQHQMPDGLLVSELSFETGQVRRAEQTAIAVGRFITAAGNAYRQGTAFERAQDWDDVSESVRTRSRELYDAILRHTELLETVFVDFEADMDVAPPDATAARLMRWLGGFHPMLVHFPVALLIAAAVAELLGLAGRRRWFFDAARFCIWVAALGGLAAAPTGWFNAGVDLARDDWVLAGHRWLGTAMLLWMIVLVVLAERMHRSGRQRGRGAYWLALFSGAILMAVTGHFGGMLVFGTDYYHW